MATLEKIRGHAVGLIALIAFALLCFIIGDLMTSSSSLFNLSKSVVGKVNGEKISIEEFNQQSEVLSEIQKSQSRQQVSDAEVKDATWNTFVQNTLLNSEAEAADITITSAELSDQTVGANPHPMLRQIPLFYDESGKFNPTILPNIIRFLDRDANEVPAEQRGQFVEQQNRVRSQWMFWEKRIKNELLLEKVSTILITAMKAPKAEADYLASLSANEYDALVARKMIADVQDKDVEVSESDIKSYYNAHKEGSYKTEGYCDLSAVLFPIAPSKGDYDEAMANMQNVKKQLSDANTTEAIKSVFVANAGRNYQYNDVYFTSTEIGPMYGEFAMSNPAGTVSEITNNQNEFTLAKVVSAAVLRPDSVKLSMIVLQAKDSAAAKGRADSVAAAIKAGAKFEELASKVSADKQSAQNGGDMGWIKEGYVAMKGFDNSAFTANVGSVFTISNAQSSFVFKVTDRTKPVKKAKIAILGVPFEPSSTTLDSIYRVANDFASATANTKDKDNAENCKAFKDNAAKSNYQVRPMNNLQQNQPSLYVLPDSRSVIKWAWDHNVGDVSDVMEIGDYYLVVCKDTMVEKGYMPVDVVKDQIKNELLKEKKADKLAAELANVKDLASVSAVDTVNAVRFTSDYIAKVGNEPALVGAIVTSKVNQLSKPVKGDMAVYMFQTIATRKSETPGISQAALNQNIQRSVLRSFMDAAKDKADIEDNRYTFF